MARRTGNTPKCVEEKRRQLPIYQHYILSPGKTKSHHPEAKCVHCLKEFVCGSKQRLIRHIRKCNSISNAEQIIAETLNTLARGSATGQLNHSILEASNLLPSQISHIQHSATQQLVGQAIHNHQNSSTNSTTVTTASSMNNIINNSNNDGSNINHNTSGSNDPLMVATSYNVASPLNDSIPVKRPQKRGRKPGSHAASGPGIHVITGMDGKTHFTPATQLPQGGGQSSSQMISPSHNGRPGNIKYAYPSGVITAATPTNTINSSGSHINTSHLSCATPNHQSSNFKLNSELIDKAYLKLVLTRNLPLSLCDTKEFQAWVKTFANDYKPPSSINLITQNLKIEAQSAKQRVSNILVKTSKKTINLELHSLPNEIRGHSWYAMIAGVDHKRFLISVRDVIGQMNQQIFDQTTDDISPEKFLKEFIDDCIKRVGSDRVNSLLLTGKGESDDVTVERACQSLYTTHPSIVTYHCWWHFTNLLCSDIIEQNEIFQEILGNSNLLMEYICKRPQLNSVLGKFSPFIGAPGTLHRNRDDSRWYSHLVCYLLEYIKSNKEAISRTLAEYSSIKLLSDNNNNHNDSLATGSPQKNSQQNNSNSSTQQTPHIVSCHEDPQLVRVKSIVMSEEFWTNLNSALVYLSSFRDVVALAQNMSINSNGNARFNSNDPLTSAISPITCNNLPLSDYMYWFLKYGKSLIDNWKQSPDSYKYQLIGRFFQRFNSAIDEFKLLFAAYLLNPKHRCAYMTQKAKDSAIEEILNIASEFMPEESDGHTIFDQWKLYLVREQPYDVVFDESRSTPLEWWLSIPCAESIRRVALRILRLKAFSSPKPDTLFSQLYFYEDETRSNLTETTFEDIAILRYFYDHEDKIGQPSIHNSAHNHTNSTHNHANPLISNGFCDRTLAGQVHNDYERDANNPARLLPSVSFESTIDSNGRFEGPPSISGDRKGFIASFSDVNESYMNHTSHLDMDNSLSDSSNLALDDLPYYDQFCMYIDFNDSGIQIVEEPVEKKKRKWTAQEILSKCHSNHLATNNNNHEVK